MTYTTGGLIQAADYNKFVQGGATVNHNVANVNTIWGAGFGNKGYGQAGALASVPTGSTVTATQWATLISRLNSIQSHQNGTNTGVAAPVAGSTISYINTLATFVDTVYNNRMTTSIQGTDSPAAVTDGMRWSTGDPTTFQIVRTFTFSNADEARYFFNGGGLIYLAFGSTAISTNLKTSNWVTFLRDRIAGLTMYATSSSKWDPAHAGTTNSNTNIGYWQLTTSDTLLYAATSSSSSVYDSNTISIKARTNGPQGSNGDNGTVITFTIDLSDVAVDDGDRNIDLTVNIHCVSRRPETTTLPTVRPFPAMTGSSSAPAATPFRSAGGYSPDLTLTEHTTNFNLYDSAMARGWNGTSPLIARIVVGDGVIVSSNSTGVSAFTVNNMPAGSSITITNNGYIVGMGGRGGDGGGTGTTVTSGSAGGNAFFTNYPVTMVNNGTIAGGGGGGGGAYSGVQWSGPPGGGGRSGIWWSQGGTTQAGRSDWWYLNGTFDSPGPAQVPSGHGNSGSGGQWGAGGYYGSGWPGDYVASYGGGGGAAVVGDSQIAWAASGTRLGAIV